MEDYMDFKDYLCLSRDKDIIAIIEEEPLLFSDKVNGLYTITLDRNMLVTTNAIYSLDNKSKIIFDIYNNI